MNTKPRPLSPNPGRSDTGFDPSAAASASAPSATPAPVATKLTPTWRTAWMAFGIAFVVVLALFWETVATLSATYMNDATYNHGFLILPIVGYLIWLRRDALVRQEPRPTAWAIAPLAVSILGWLAGSAGGVDMVEQLGLLGVLWSLFLGIFGWRVVRELVFPLFYAVFAVPLGDFLVAPLQDITALIAVKGIELVGIPVYSDGLLITIPPGNFEVAETCAGLRFLIATIALGFLFAYLTYKSVWRRVLFLALCIVVPIIANGIRAWGIVFIGYESDMTAAVGFDHIIYGWIFFTIVTAILLGLGISFRDRPIGDIPPPTGMPDLRPPVSRGLIAGVAAGLIALCAVGPAYAALVVNRPAPSGKIALVPPQIGNGWRLVESYGEDWKPAFATADATVLRSYIKDGHTVHVFIAFYRTQFDGHEVVNYNNRVYDGKMWMRVGSSKIGAKVESVPLVVESTRMLRGRAGRVAWSWHWVSDTFTADPYRAKWLETKAKLFGGARAAAEVAIATDYRDNPAETTPVLQDFLNSAGPWRPVLARAAGG